jgi:hypothetical protein
MNDGTQLRSAWQVVLPAHFRFKGMTCSHEIEAPEQDQTRTAGEVQVADVAHRGVHPVLPRERRGARAARAKRARHTRLGEALHRSARMAVQRVARAAGGGVDVRAHELARRLELARVANEHLCTSQLR